MVFAYFDRVKETSATTGTGALSLAGAVTGFRAFSDVYSNSNTFYYTVTDQSGAAWETGIGTYTSSGNLLTRTTVKASSNSGSAVNFTSAALYCYVTPIADGLPSAAGVTGTGANVLATSPVLVTPALGTPTSGVLTSCTGTASGLTAGNVTTNANMTGDVTSVGNAQTAASKFPKVLAQSGAAVSHTGDTIETTLVDYTLPANTLPANGELIIESAWAQTGSTGVTDRIRFSTISGTIIQSLPKTTQTGDYNTQIILSANNATNSQIVYGNPSGQNPYATNVTRITTAVDTTAATHIVFTTQLTNSANTETLLCYKITLYQP